MLPIKTFVATLAEPAGLALRSARDLDDRNDPSIRSSEPYSLRDVVLEATPHKDEHWAFLHAYMTRRFGPPPLGSEDYKDLSCKWLLSTPDPEVFVLVGPSMVGARYSFLPLVSVPMDAPLETRLDAARMRHVAEAYRATLLDLLRPVCVRDGWFNATGMVGNDDPLLELNELEEDAEEQPYTARYYEHAGWSIPAGLFGGKDWAALCAAVYWAGQGDYPSGRRAVIELLHAEILASLAEASAPTQVLVAAHLQGEAWAGALARAPLSAVVRAEAETFLVRMRACDDAFLDAIETYTQADFAAAGRVLDALGIGGIGCNLSDTFCDIERARAVRRAWRELVVLVGESEIPDVVARQGLAWLQAGCLATALRETGAEDLARWVDTTQANPHGAAALGIIFHHLQRHLDATA